eukprot:2081480-Pyramimonas_sp.AAC.1
MSSYRRILSGSSNIVKPTTQEQSTIVEPSGPGYVLPLFWDTPPAEGHDRLNPGQERPLVRGLPIAACSATMTACAL